MEQFDSLKALGSVSPATIDLQRLAEVID